VLFLLWSFYRNDALRDPKGPLADRATAENGKSTYQLPRRHSQRRCPFAILGFMLFSSSSFFFLPAILETTWAILVFFCALKGMTLMKIWGDPFLFCWSFARQVSVLVR
jgi:hypothetical protein